MFHNCEPARVREYSAYVPSSIVTEASGGITLENLGDYRGTNVDYISLGFITHSAKALDISLEVSDRKSTRLNSSHVSISYAVFCLKKNKQTTATAIEPT